MEYKLTNRMVALVLFGFLVLCLLFFVLGIELGQRWHWGGAGVDCKSLDSNLSKGRALANDGELALEKLKKLSAVPE